MYLKYISPLPADWAPRRRLAFTPRAQKVSPTRSAWSWTSFSWSLCLANFHTAEFRVWSTDWKTSRDKDERVELRSDGSQADERDPFLCRKFHRSSGAKSHCCVSPLHYLPFQATYPAVHRQLSVLKFLFLGKASEVLRFFRNCFRLFVALYLCL